jgi:hypothetical protein
MSKKTLLLTLTILFLLFAVVGTPSRATRTAGVNKGDFFKYSDITISGNFTAPPTSYETLDQMLWIESNVTSVSGTNITGQLTLHYKNGTENTEGGWINVDTGDGENLTVWFVSANLGVNDTIYNSSSYSTATINSTAPKAYASGVRDTSCLNITYFSEVNANQNYSESISLYWDRSTGALVGYSIDYLNRTGPNTTVWKARVGITDASVWAVPEFPIWGLTFLTLVGLTPAILMVCKRRPKVTEDR